VVTESNLMTRTERPRSRPTADVSVRIAWADDASAIGALQVQAWQERYKDILPAELLTSLRPAELSEVWAQSISRPRDARQRVLVALERNIVHGFAATAPSTDPDANPAIDGEVAELEVESSARGRGHGSRLLHAAIDTMRADNFTRATVWLNSDNDAMRGFLAASGWAPDGAYRELDLHGDGTVRVRQIRLHTDLTQY
jgi:GNAT superfamily N-acetyltransferase